MGLHITQEMVRENVPGFVSIKNILLPNSFEVVWLPET